MNPAGLSMIEADSFASVKGISVFELIAPEHQEAFRAFHQSVMQGHNKELVFDITGKKGSRKTVESHAVPLYGRSGNIEGHLAITRDITNAKQLADKLSYQASHDGLTGLVNRVEFEHRLHNSIARASADNCTHAVFFMDLDQFKVINDTCGHLAGDQLLIRTGAVLRKQLRQQDTVARLGGDEFAVLLDYCSEEEAIKLANRLREEIAAIKFQHQGRSMKVSASIGVVMIDRLTPNVTEILRCADLACYAAKDSGRNHVYLYSEDDGQTAQRQGEMDWIATIHSGIDEKRFSLYAQLIENLDGAKHGYHAEILLRYIDESGNTFPPGAFLPAAERYGITPSIDRYVVENTLQMLASEPLLLENIKTYCINLSGHSIANQDFRIFVENLFDKYDTLAEHICFEITETAAISNLSSAIAFIECLKKLGCRFSLDDFGSGLSSFGYLKNLPVDYVKIDGEFVRDITTNSLHLAMIRSINDISHLMGKKTVAEFVENDEIKALLVEMGVDFAQGYGIHKPGALEDLIQLNSSNSMPLSAAG